MAEEQLDLEFDDVRSNFAECPPAGIYEDQDFQSWYAPIKAINSGIVTWGQVSQRHFKAAFDGKIPSEDTLSRKFGRAVHTRLLEPDKFDERVLIASPCCALLKSGDRKGMPCGKSASSMLHGAWFCGTHKPDEAVTPEEFITQDELVRIEAMATALHGHPAMSLLRAKGWSECSIIYDWNGLKMKGRLDRYSADLKFICDVKKVRVGRGTMEECRKAIASYGYLRQAAIYWRGIEILTGARPRFVWLFIEENEPFDVQLVEPEEWELEHAWSQVSGILAGFKSCLEADKFDGYVRVDQLGKIISSHKGAYPTWMADKIQRGEA